MARQMGWQGRVKVRIWLSVSGQVKKVQVIDGSGHDILDKSVIKAVKEYDFPAGEYDEIIDLTAVRFILE